MTGKPISVLLMCSKHKQDNSIIKAIKDMPFNVSVCTSREEAMLVLESVKLEIVITEYQLDDSNGVDFLQSVFDKVRMSTRIIVGEKANEELIIKAVIKGIACTYIDEAAQKGLIKRKLEDIARIRSTMTNTKLMEILRGSPDFPINMAVYEQLMEAMHDDLPIPVISRIISKDVALTAKVLQVANSAFYGNFSGSSIEKAIIYMGLNPVKDIVLMHSLSTNLKMTAAQNKELESIVRHSIVTNYYMHAIAKKTGGCPITPLNNSSGIIHDIGKLVQLVFFPMEYNSIVEYRDEHPDDDYYTCETETHNMSIGHSEIGAYFLRCWNFNQFSIEAALFHHEPEQSSEDVRGCVEMLFLANTIADIRDGYNLSLDEALERCTKIKLDKSDMLTILPPI